MMELKISDAKKNFHQRNEDDEFEVKSQLIVIKKMSKIILSYINGNKNRPVGYIILGVGETDGKADFDLVKPLLFPIILNVHEDDKSKNPEKMKIENASMYIKKVLSYLRKNTSPQIDPHSYITASIESYPDVPNGFYIIFAVKRDETQLIQYNQDRKFYGRFKKVMRDDFESRPMESVEVVNRMRERYYSQKNLAETFYQGSVPAVPELTVLFDLIYFGDTKKVLALLGQIPTLTQMTDSHKCNALHVATVYENEDLIKTLIDDFAMSIYQTDEDGNSPILTAAYVGNIGLIEFFLEKDRHLINHRDRFGCDIFLKASSYGHTLLLEHLHNRFPILFLQTTDYEGLTVLETCLSCEDNGDTLKFLLKLHKWEITQLKNALNLTDEESLRNILLQAISELSVAHTHQNNSPASDIGKLGIFPGVANSGATAEQPGVQITASEAEISKKISEGPN